MVDQVYGDTALKKTAIYDILKKVKTGKEDAEQRPFNAKKTKRTAALIDAVNQSITETRRISVKELAASHDVSSGS